MINRRRHLWTEKLAGKMKTAPLVQLAPAAFTGIILGIDPSLRGSGFSVIEVAGPYQIHLRESLTLKLTPKRTFVECLGEIFLTTQRFLDTYTVKAVSIEQTIYVQNSKTAHILGSARGACLSAVALKKIPVSEFLPLRIKKAVVGTGQATKNQVAQMVCRLLQLPAPLPPDESDATAAALCYFFSLKSLRSV